MKLSSSLRDVKSLEHKMIFDSTEITKAIRTKARDLGFDLVAVSPARNYPESQYYKEWLARGYEGEMGYMRNTHDKRADIQNVLPGAKSVICCAINYNSDFPYSTELNHNSRGWISRYAWFDDYHEILIEMLNELNQYLYAIITIPFNSKYYVDTGPVLEKIYSKYSGVGWLGKNTCLINQELGSWLLLGELIVDIELEYDIPVPDRCGSCTKCIESCPTDAIVDPYVLDARKCISYLTIELKGVIPVEFRENMESNIFGCDICQDVCPWNKKAPVSSNEHFKPKNVLLNPLLSEIADITLNEFNRIFKKSPISRARKRGMLRNIILAMGNSSDESLIRYIIEAMRDNEPVVRATAIWAYSQLSNGDITGELNSLLVSEDNPLVRDEILNILN